MSTRIRLFRKSRRYHLLWHSGSLLGCRRTYCRLQVQQLRATAPARRAA